MNNKISLVAILFFNITLYCFSQIVEFGIGISPYSTVETTSTVTVEFKDNYLWKILDYFATQDFDIEEKENTDTDISEVNISSVAIKTALVRRTTEQFVIVEASSTIKFDELKRLFYGFGRREIIRLLLIKQNSKIDISIKSLVELRRKNTSMNEIAQKCGLDYITDIWLPSERIYNQLFGEERK